MCAAFAQHASKSPFRGMPLSYKGSSTIKLDKKGKDYG